MNYGPELSLDAPGFVVIPRTKYRFRVQRPIAFLDVGAWRSNQSGKDVITTFGVVAGHEILLCTWLRLPKSAHFRPKAWDRNPELKGLKGEFGSDRGFVLKRRRMSGPLVEKGKVLLVLPDLHLHYFRLSPWDSFAMWDESNNKRISLEDELSTLLAAVNSLTNPKVELIQAGDMYERWGSLIGIERTIDSLSTPANIVRDDPTYRLSDEYLEKLEQADKHRLTLKKWQDSYMEIVKSIEEQYDKLFNGEKPWGRKSGFAGIIQGNHDNELPTKKEHRTGINNCIHIEHLHALDSYNNDANWEKRGHKHFSNAMLAESLRVGDFARSIPERVDPGYIPRMRRRATEKARELKVDLFIMGHTHEPELWIDRGIRETIIDQ